MMTTPFKQMRLHSEVEAKNEITRNPTRMQRKNFSGVRLYCQANEKNNNKLQMHRKMVSTSVAVIRCRARGVLHIYGSTILVNLLVSSHVRNHIGDNISLRNNRNRFRVCVCSCALCQRSRQTACYLIFV